MESMDTKRRVFIKAHPREWVAIWDIPFDVYEWDEENGVLYVDMEWDARVQELLENFRREHFEHSIAEAMECLKLNIVEREIRFGNWRWAEDGTLYMADEYESYKKRVRELRRCAADIREEQYRRWVALGKPWPWRDIVERCGAVFLVFSCAVLDNNEIEDIMFAVDWYVPPPPPVATERSSR